MTKHINSHEVKTVDEIIELLQSMKAKYGNIEIQVDDHCGGVYAISHIHEYDDGDNSGLLEIM